MPAPELPNPVDYAVPAFVVLVLAEMLVARARDRRHLYCPRDTLTSLALGLGSTVAGMAVAVPPVRCRLGLVLVAAVLRSRRSGLLRLPPLVAPGALVLGEPCHPPFVAAL